MLGENWLADRGNALVEFLVGGLLLQLLLLSLVTTLSARVDSQAAADLMARQALRSSQLGLSRTSVQSEVSSIAKTFGLALSDYAIWQSGSCPYAISISVRVHDSIGNARAKCH